MRENILEEREKVSMTAISPDFLTSLQQWTERLDKHPCLCITISKEQF